MKHWGGVLTGLLVGMTLTLSGIGDADARRLGGGKSFGGKSSFSQPHQRRAAPQRAPAQPSAAQQRNTQQRAALANRGGLMGMLGGLALGGLLGALFFGGAFENVNFFDILILGLVGFLLYKLFAARRRAAGASGAVTPAASGVASAGGYSGAGAGREEVGSRPTAHRRFDTDILFRKADGGEAAGGESGAEGWAPTAGGGWPKGFDVEGFLRGAKAAYRQLQASWDEHDLRDLRALTTDAVFAELQKQLQGRQGESRTELLKVDAQLLEATEVGEQAEAAVLFDVLMRELEAHGPTEVPPYRVREVWHFVRPAGSDRPTWFLDGIQQLEE